jgi:DNA sulfur modification protein DndD
MIIRNIQIDNYLCYYGSNSFELSEGLNIILGENGEGKTKFFESIDWLFNGENRELNMLVSAKRLEEAEIGDMFPVSVSMIIEQYGEKSTLKKSYIVKKERPNECSTSNFKIEGISENSSGERTQVDGQALLDRIFPFEIRKYVMFKGEADLNIFASDDALTNLINLFSQARHYDKYSKKGMSLREKADSAVEDSSRRSRKNVLQDKRLESEINELIRDKANYHVLLNASEEDARNIEGNIELAESHVSNAEAWQTLNNRIQIIQNKIDAISVDENYTTALFDENWILVNFEPYHKAFAEKVAVHSKARRELQSDFDKQKGMREGERRAKAVLLNNAVPLPIGSPSKSHMEEMLNDEICKVCNREAKKGSEEYDFMMNKLRDYLESQMVEENVTETDEAIFKFDYTNKLEYLSVSHEDNLKNIRVIRTKIIELFEYNEARRRDIKDFNAQLDVEKTERDRILGNSSIAEEKLHDVLKNFSMWQKDLKKRNQEIVEYSNKLTSISADLKLKREEKDRIESDSANSFLINTREILRDIEIIFENTKDSKFDEFIEKLNNKSNNFFKKINIDAFTGNILFTKRSKLNRTIVEIELQEEGRTFYKPNQSLLTSMHISILFAISELASEIKDENFPMIFDAPTSSFGESKTSQFLNLIYETENQKILLLKDFLVFDSTIKDLTIKKEFDNIRKDKAFWIKLERPFDANNLKTINSQVITL